MAAMKKQYGGKKGESVFYASKNKGKITGVDRRHTRDDQDPPYQAELEKITNRMTGTKRSDFADAMSKFKLNLGRRTGMKDEKFGAASGGNRRAVENQKDTMEAIPSSAGMGGMSSDEASYSPREAPGIRAEGSENKLLGKMISGDKKVFFKGAVHDARMRGLSGRAALDSAMTRTRARITADAIVRNVSRAKQ
jgi:hypothetical protein